ncbi:MAG: hypothetical protein JNM19_03055 [Chitinophagaceae bacterium]|nr:hypothetical protein [Chitinophagaceae bacterium]
MKKIITLFLFVYSFRLQAQEALSYSQILENNTEISFQDSLLITNLGSDRKTIDTFTVKKWFLPALSGSQDVKLKNRNFFLAGKITTNDHFDLHVLVEDKKKEDSTVLQIVHLVTTRKDGSYISAFKAAVTGTKKKSNYYTSSWLYKGFSIVQDSKIVTSTASLADVTQYKINKSGRFIMYSNY